jgi:uncharacterized protein involved in type VI secretion and phage assembly
MSATPDSFNSGSRRFYGKFRGTVIDNQDPKQLGRIMAQVSAVFGATPCSWALPCVPAAGDQAGCFIVPPIGSQVWIEFEQGNPDYPIWTGGFWGDAENLPAAATDPAPAIPPGLGQNIVLQTTGQNSLVVSDAEPTQQGGGVVLQSPAGAMLVVNDSGVYITAGPGKATISLMGEVVAINQTALTISMG